MLFLVLVVVVCFLAVSNAFHVPMGARKYRLYMSTTAEGEKKLGKVEAIKVRSNYLKDPLQEELSNEEIFVSPDAVVVLKYHGSYMQDNRDKVFSS
jgi:hypothetical protein